MSIRNGLACAQVRERVALQDVRSSSTAVPTLTASNGVVGTNALSLPTPASFNVPNNKAVVFELLRVITDNSPNGANLAAVTGNSYLKQSLELQIAPSYSSAAPGLQGYASPVTVVHTHWSVVCQPPAGDQSFTIQNSVQEWDLTDGAGHGVVVPSPNFNLVVIQQWGANVTTTTANYVAARILFRYKLVDLAEYLQMVSALGIGTF